MKTRILICCACLFAQHPLLADVRLPAIFGDHMVMQQRSTVPVWGWADPMEEITITCSWDGATYTIKVDSYAKWQVDIKTPPAGGPFTMTIQGHNTIQIRDILMGEVWLGSGQSNMQWSANAGIEGAEEAVSSADYPEIRFFQVGRRAADTPQLDLEGQWEVCTPESMANFSAVGYFFARRLHETLQQPIGIINSSWGGTPAETWINAARIAKNDRLKQAAEKIKPMPWCPEAPGQTFNSMIAPLIPFPLAGVIWYQGETNTANPESYTHMFTTLIEDWRTEWGTAFPFYFVQIAPYRYDEPEAGVKVRDAQRRTLSVPNTGMVVISDIGNLEDIHPKNKSDVGLRLANWALAKTYEKTELTFSGPLYSGMEVEGKKIRVSFAHTGKGLVAKGGRLTHFEIAGADGNFVEARAQIDGNTVVVRSPQVPEPVAVRFAWSNTAVPNLFNEEGLPASSFTSENWQHTK